MLSGVGEGKLDCEKETNYRRTEKDYNLNELKYSISENILQIYLLMKYKKTKSPLIVNILSYSNKMESPVVVNVMAFFSLSCRGSH